MKIGECYMIHVVKNKEEILNILKIENMLIMINFHSETCGPCIMQMPILEDLSNDKKITLITFDVEEGGDVLEHFNVSATPTTMIYKDGKMVFQNVGFLSYEE
jgi:thioredoxin 1